MMMMMRNPLSLSSSCERDGPAKKIVVAVNAVAATKEKDIPRLALKWVLDEVANPAAADSILFLALASADKPPARKGWVFPILSGDCANAAKKEQDKTPRRKSFSSQMRDGVEALCNQMIQTLQPKVKIKVKVVPADSPGIVAVESSKARAAWVVLDKQLKKEEKHCMEELQCTVVAMKRSGAKSLKVPLVREHSAKSLPISGEGLQKEVESQSQGTRNICCEGKAAKHGHGGSGGSGVVVVVVEGVASMSSPDMEHPFTATETTTSSATSSEQEASPLPTSRGRRQLPKPLEATPDDTNYDLDIACDAAAAAESDSDRFNHNLLPNNWARPDSRTKLGTKVWEAANSSSFRSRDRLSCFSVCEDPCGANVVQSCSSPRVVNMKHDPKLIPNNNNNKSLNPKMMMMHKERYAKFDAQGTNQQQQVNDLDRTSSVRKAVSLNRSPPPVPPPLCSICQHKSPIIGKPPRWFSYSELEYATNGFSRDNFLAEGGFGSVHKGVLSDGQVVAVKQHKHASSQGDMEFCSEVEVLSCAQHRNVVMLIGFCTEDQRRLLVYEYVCNGSLDHHLYGREQNTLEWSARYKIAIGAARGLRYLHEECRVGCIVHRDLRPNNILLTHDFEPMVGDFGLARWQPDGDLGVETRVIGTLGYLAPEYAQSGQITEKADVFSFGVVLLEIVTGRRAVDITKPRGQQCLAEWARPLLEENAVPELVDPRLQHDYSEHEVVRVLHAAALCIRKDPSDRPRMSRVIRILEGDVMYPNSSSVLPHYDAVSRSRMSVHSPTAAPPPIRDEI